MKHLVEDTGQPLPRLQGKVHVRDGGLDSIANELLHRGVCEWISYQLAEDACVDAHVI